jgi:hypothetical protein
MQSKQQRVKHPLHARLPCVFAKDSLEEFDLKLLAVTAMLIKEPQCSSHSYNIEGCCGRM